MFRAAYVYFIKSRGDRPSKNLPKQQSVENRCMLGIGTATIGILRKSAASVSWQVVRRKTADMIWSRTGSKRIVSVVGIVERLSVERMTINKKVLRLKLWRRPVTKASNLQDNFILDTACAGRQQKSRYFWRILYSAAPSLAQLAANILSSFRTAA